MIPKKFNVILVSYEGVKSCLKELSSIDWHCIVIDEAHKIKNEETQLALKLRELKTKSKLLLTGTPLQNNIHELWNLLNFIMP